MLQQVTIFTHMFISSSAGFKEVGCKSPCGNLYHGRLFFWSSLLLQIAAISMSLLRMGLQLQRLSFPHQLLFKKVVLKTSDFIYHFRVKNG